MGFGSENWWNVNRVKFRWEIEEKSLVFSKLGRLKPPYPPRFRQGCLICSLMSMKSQSKRHPTRTEDIVHLKEQVHSLF